MPSLAKTILMIEIIFILIGLAAGFAIGYLFAKKKSSDKSSDGGIFSEKEFNSLKEKVSDLLQENGSLKGRLEKSLEVFEEQRDELETKSEELKIMTVEHTAVSKENEHLQERLKEQLKDLEKLDERFKKEFQNVANTILKQNSKEFSEANQKQVGEILKPLKVKIKEFEEKIDKSSQERNTLKGELQKMFELNQKMSEEASNLTRALKGDSKAQGTWGELILAKVLERSGLVEGIEYKQEDFSSNQEGSSIRPDVVVYLPEDKHIIIDSKVTLVAYEQWVGADTEEEKLLFSKQHLESVKRHIKQLGDKDYQFSVKHNSPEFILMFMPIEAAFSAAIQMDSELFTYAWDRKIVIVSPSTLLATLRTVASIWKQEKQNKNVARIAEESGRLYDKFVNFLEDFEKIRKSLDQSVKAYDGAFNKLTSGKGNLIKRAQDIKALGAKASKSIDQSLLDQSVESE